MSEHDAILELYAEYKELADGLAASNELTFASTASAALTKNLLLAAASRLEVVFSESICSLFSSEDPAARIKQNFVRNRALSRRFHTFFDWEKNNIGQVFSAFGPEFKTYAQELTRDDEEFTTSYQSFLQICSLRNELVHNDFATFPIDKTLDELAMQYSKSAAWLETLRHLVESFEK
jgi:hypothetical protein